MVVRLVPVDEQHYGRWVLDLDTPPQALEAWLLCCGLDRIAKHGARVGGLVRDVEAWLEGEECDLGGHCGDCGSTLVQ